MATNAGSWRWLTLTLLPLCLSACEEGVSIDVDQVAGHIAVAVSPQSSSSPPCVKRVIVFRGSDEATAIWHIVRTDPNVCLNRFTFGEIPRGFVSDTTVQQPARGVKYEIDISGVGFNSGTTFVSGDHDGRIGHG